MTSRSLDFDVFDVDNHMYETREALTKFIRAFDDLDWEHFRLAFDDNATVFYPRAMPQRANGRAEWGFR